MAEGCLLSQYCLPALYGGSALLGLLLLRIAGGKRLSCTDYLAATVNLFFFVLHITMDAYPLIHGRITPKGENEPVPKPDDYLGCYQNAVRKIWREYGAIDTRVYLDDQQPMFLSVMYACAIGGSVLTFLTYFAHLIGAKSAHVFQIIAGVWHLAVVFYTWAPEHFVNYKHVKNFNVFAAMNAVFIIFPAIFILSAWCKLCCGSCAGGVCPISSSTGGHKDDKKKKQ